MLDTGTIEILYSSWTNVSIILLTAALVFYHMMRVKSFTIPKGIGAFIACSLILVNILFTINSIIPYYRRSSEILKTETNKNENGTRDVYFAGGIFFIVIELIICFYIIYDSLGFAGL